ncbi:Protein SHQ1 like [Dissostichus eleginoides]|uniref:Protein SHQ1 like n=1 Tax=Dissostichus eleginoides TaxID=100907 RepID=A0AAD9F8V3_DISEL|nr:Protein SHQ1 like [Dissostichus eleginoides]
MEERGGAPSGCDSDGGERRSSFRLSVMEERGGLLQVVTVMEERGGAPPGCDSEEERGGAPPGCDSDGGGGGAPSGCDSDGGERRSSFRLSQ